MSPESVSANVAHSQTLKNLTALTELGTCAVMRCLGTDEAADTLNGVQLTKEDIQEALAARLASNLGI